MSNNPTIGPKQSTTLKDLECLQGKFVIFSRRGWWKIDCLNCDAKWSLQKKTALHVGNMLHLLNHHAMHMETAEQKKERSERVRRLNQEAVRILSGIL